MSPAASGHAFDQQVFSTNVHTGNMQVLQQLHDLPKYEKAAMVCSLENVQIITNSITVQAQGLLYTVTG